MPNAVTLAYSNFIAAAARKQLSEMRTPGLPARKLHIPAGLSLGHVLFAWNGAMQVNRLGLIPALYQRDAPRKIPNSGWGPWGKQGGTGLQNYWSGSNFISANNTYSCWFKETRTLSVADSYSPPICMFGWDSSGTHGLGIDGGYLTIGNGSTSGLKGATYVADGEWHLAVFVNAGATNKYDVYVDVNGVMTKQNGTTPWTPPYASGLSFVGMGYNYSTNHTGPQDVAAWRIFGVSLTLAQIQDIYDIERNTLRWLTDANLGKFAVDSIVNVSFSVISPDNSPVIYSLTGGTLPYGLSISNGELAGTLGGGAGTYSFSVKAENDLGQSEVRTFNFAADLLPVWKTPAGLLGSFVKWQSVIISLLATDNTSISSYTMIGGALPSGLALNISTGSITGTAPSLAADTTYSFTIRATDNTGSYTDRNFSILVYKTIDAQFLTNELLLSDSFTDLSIKKRSVALVGNATPTSDVTAFGLNTIKVDGSGDAFYLPYDANLCNWYQGDYTLEYWLQINNFATAASNNRPTAMGAMTYNDYRHDWGFGPRSNTQLVFLYWNGSSVIEATTTVPVIQLGVRNYYTLSFQKSTNTIRLFYNGSLMKTVVGLVGTPSLGYGMSFGMYYNTSLDGNFFDIRVSRTLRYSANFTVPSATLPRS